MRCTSTPFSVTDTVQLDQSYMPLLEHVIHQTEKRHQTIRNLALRLLEGVHREFSQPTNTALVSVEETLLAHQAEVALGREGRQSGQTNAVESPALLPDFFGRLPLDQPVDHSQQEPEVALRASTSLWPKSENRTLAVDNFQSPKIGLRDFSSSDGEKQEEAKGGAGHPIPESENRTQGFFVIG